MESQNSQDPHRILSACLLHGALIILVFRRGIARFLEPVLSN
jgi:hypothetical protein